MPCPVLGWGEGIKLVRERRRAEGRPARRT